jgi:hypothetical protein
MIADLRQLALSPLIGEPYVLEVDIAPEALTARLRAIVNHQPKRLFGVLKVGPHWVGTISGDAFVVWEKQQHATRAEGRIRKRRGGSRVEAHIGVTRRTRILTIVFFLLFVVGAVGILAREGSLGLAPAGLTVAALGALVTLSLFWASALRQRAALRAFLNEVFAAP